MDVRLTKSNAQRKRPRCLEEQKLKTKGWRKKTVDRSKVEAEPIDVEGDESHAERGSGMEGDLMREDRPFLLFPLTQFTTNWNVKCEMYRKMKMNAAK